MADKKHKDINQDQDENPDYQDEFYEKIDEEGTKGGQAVKDRMHNKDFVPGQRSEDLEDEETNEPGMSEYDEEP